MTSSAHALADVLAAEGGGEGGFQAPSIAEFYPSMSMAGACDIGVADVRWV